MNTLKTVMFMSTLGMLIGGAEGHAAACETTYRMSKEGMEECLFEMKYLGLLLSNFVKDEHKVDVYMDFNLTVGWMKIHACCNDLEYQAYNENINPLEELHYPSYLTRNPPVFSFELRHGVTFNNSDMFALAMFDMSGFRKHNLLGWPARPPIHWLVVNIHGLNIKGGMTKTLLEYKPPLGNDLFMFLILKHPNMISEIDLASYHGLGEGCAPGFTDLCIMNFEQIMEDNGMEVVGVTWLRVKSSPYSTYKLLKSPYSFNYPEVCPEHFPNVKVFEKSPYIDCTVAGPGSGSDTIKLTYYTLFILLSSIYLL